MTQIVILAAGASSRFYPLAESTHKTMFSLCGKPILGWTLEGLKNSGFKNVVVVIPKSDKNLEEYLKTFKDITIKITYQDEPLGMGDALLTAKEFLEEEFIVGFGHFINSKVFELLEKEKASKEALIAADTTNEPWKYGILDLKGDYAVGITEKPKKGEEKGNVRAAGLYLLNKEFVKTLEQVAPGQYNFEAALDDFMKANKVQIVKTDNLIFPFKYPWDLFKIKDYLLETLPVKRAKSAEIAKTAILKGKVIIEEGAKIFDYATIQGPVYIGKNAVVGPYCTLRDHSILEEGAEIQRYADCARSIFSANSHMHFGFIGDSIFGKNVRLGAGFVTANRRVDRADVNVLVKEEKISTKSSYLGVIMGDLVKAGINVSTMPGVLVGSQAQIGPGTVVLENIAPKTLVYSDHKKSLVTKKIK